MADEATVTGRLDVSNSTTEVQFHDPTPQSFSADVAGTKGPSPGTVECAAAGTQIDLLANLDDPSLYKMYNCGTVPVDVGVYDPSLNRAYFFHRLLPGEAYPGRFSPYLFGETGAGTAGTGSVGSDNNVLYVRGAGGEGLLYIGAFDG